MKRIAILITILLACTNIFAQKHPKDKEIEAALLAYLKEDTLTILDDLEYFRTLDLSEQEYINMYAERFQVFMFSANNVLKINSEQQKIYKAKREEYIKIPELYQVYNDSLALLETEQKKAEVFLKAYKTSYDSCITAARNADTVSNFAYQAWVVLHYRYRSAIPGSYICKGLTPFLVTKGMDINFYLRLNEEDPLFPDE